MMANQFAAIDTGCNMDKFLVLLCFSVLFASQDAFVPRDPSAYRIVAPGSFDRALMRFLKDVYEASEDKNVITSPLGVFMLLSLYSTAANGTCKEEIRELLGFVNYNYMTESYESLSEIFASVDPKLLTLANKVCVSEKYELDERFLTLATRRYHSEVDTLDFNDPQVASDSVNQWADRKSGGNIKNPVTPDTFSPDTVVLLLNIIYFQGKWRYPFGAADTEEKEFYINETESVRKPTMRLTQSLLYGENRALRARLVQLPYEDTDFTMLLILPDDVAGLPMLLEILARFGMFRTIRHFSMTDRNVHLEMPKFEVKTRSKLKKILEEEGAGRIFTDYVTGVVKGEDVKVSEVFQEAFIRVDEGGTTAAAFTLFNLELRCYIEENVPLEFKVDRPFFYAIMHMDIVLFAGTYTH